MGRHARPPEPPQEPEVLDTPPERVVDEDGDDVVDTDLPPSKRARGGKRKTLRGLPDDDPFVLIAQIDATGGVDGTKKRMSNTIAAAFRAYCLLGPDVRTLVALHKRLERDWGKPPMYETLKGWARTWRWEELAGEYDLALDRLRLWQREQGIREMDERQAKKNRALEEMASNEIAKIVRDFNAGPKVLRDPATGKVVYKRDGTPALGPRPTLAGIQGLAVLYKIAQEGERVALGAPTGNSPTVIQTQQTHQTLIDARTQQTAVVPLDEWRRRTSAERVAAALGEGDGAPTGGPTQPLPMQPRALPAPERAPVTPRVVEALSDAEAGDLPDDWFPGSATQATHGPEIDAARRAADPLLGDALADPDPDPDDPDNDSED